MAAVEVVGGRAQREQEAGGGGGGGMESKQKLEEQSDCLAESNESLEVGRRGSVRQREQDEWGA